MPDPTVHDVTVPPGATDCHVHVFGPHGCFPLAPVRAYTPAEADVSALHAVLEAAGVRRSVLVQPSAYGSDNSCLLHALEAGRGSSRGIVSLAPDTPDSELARMHAAGVRGVRVNLITLGRTNTDAAGPMILAIADRVAPFGWHVQVLLHLAMLDAVAPAIEASATQIVIDHMGLPATGQGTEQPGFARLRGLVTEGRCWVKLSGPYLVSSSFYGDASTDRIARTLVAANPHRVLWGSDWPHVASFRRQASSEPPCVGFRPIEYSRIVGLTARWTKSEEERCLILVDNPERLYGFPPWASQPEGSEQTPSVGVPGVSGTARDRIMERPGARTRRRNPC